MKYKKIFIEAKEGDEPFTHIVSAMPFTETNPLKPPYIKPAFSLTDVHVLTDDELDNEVMEFANWLHKNNMRNNAFFGWGGDINTNYYGSKTADLLKLFKSQRKKEHEKQD